MNEAIGAARGGGGLDAAAIAPRAVTGVVPKEAGGDHRAVLAEVAGVALAHPAHAVAMAAAVGAGEAAPREARGGTRRPRARLTGRREGRGGTLA